MPVIWQEEVIKYGYYWIFALWDEHMYIIIAERYPNRDAAEMGHMKQCEYCKSNPEGVYSVQTDRYEYFDDTKNERGF